MGVNGTSLVVLKLANSNASPQKSRLGYSLSFTDTFVSTFMWNYISCRKLALTKQYRLTQLAGFKDSQKRRKWLFISHIQYECQEFMCRFSKYTHGFPSALRYEKETVAAWNCTQQNQRTIFSNVVMIFEERHCYWVFQMCFYGARGSTGQVQSGSIISTLNLVGYFGLNNPLLLFCWLRCSHRPREKHLASELSLAKTSLAQRHEGVSQEEARHCIIQARLLSYRTGLFGFYCQSLWCVRGAGGAGEIEHTTTHILFQIKLSQKEQPLFLTFKYQTI